MKADSQATVKTAMYPLRKRIENVIDRGEWKNSWHLPKGRYGDPDWFSPETADTVKQLLQDAISSANRLLQESVALMESIDWEHYEQVRRERLEDSRHEA